MASLVFRFKHVFVACVGITALLSSYWTRRISSTEDLVGAHEGRPRMLLTLPPSSLFVAGRQGRVWLYVFCSDLRCSRSLVMADDRAVDWPSRLVSRPSRMASPPPLPPFARSSSYGPPRRDYDARRACVTVRAWTVLCPPTSNVRTSTSGRRAPPHHHARCPLLPLLSLPPLLLGICRARHLCRPSPPCESAWLWGGGCFCAAGC
jgi:hypothetical protein